MAYTTVDNPELYFQTKLYTGSNSDLSVTFDGSENMQPDWVWLKSRGSGDHIAYDSVRGTNKRLQPNATDAEVDRSGNNDELKSFNTNGWTLGTFNSNITGAGNSCVSWNWKAGTSFTNDASSTGVGSIDSSGSVSTTAGFSIISWTGSGSGATIAHGLGAQPQIVFVKNRDDTASWNVYTVIGGGGKGLFLNDNAAFDSDSSYFNDGTASTTTFPVGSANTANGSSDNMIAYCFANVKGYSKIGSYIGNGNASGTFVYTGFKPAFIMYKNTARAISWLIHDNKRLGYNPDNDEQHPDTSAADGTDDRADILSNGFKIRESSNLMNVSGEQVIYMAFAESPFVTSGGVPTTGR